MSSYKNILSPTTFNGFNPEDLPGEATYYGVRLAIVFLLYKKVFHQNNNIIRTLEQAIYNIFSEELTANEPKIYHDWYEYRRKCLEYKIVYNNKTNKPKYLIDPLLGGIEHPDNSMGIDPILEERLNDNYKNKLPHMIIIDLCKTLCKQYKKNTENYAQIITANAKKILHILRQYQGIYNPSCYNYVSPPLIQSESHVIS